METADIEKLIEALNFEINALQEGGKGISETAKKEQKKQFTRLTRRRNILRRQMASLATARRLLSLWHTVHIPIGMAVFSTAIFHIFAAIYYATLLR